MIKVFVLRGLPGAGKSYAINRILANLSAAKPAQVPALQYRVCSADHFFTGKDGVYRFVPGDLPLAHGACLRSFVAALLPDERDLEEYPADVLFVDNTNLSVAEMAPYIAVGQAYGAEVEIVTIECDPAVAAARNQHGVPADRYDGLVARMTEGTKGIMPWWKHTVMQAG